MNRLIVLIDPEWPRQQGECDWQLFDARGRRLAEGRSAPRHWPGVDGRPRNEGGGGDARQAPDAVFATLILTRNQIVCQPLKLPAGRAGKRPEILAAGLEDNLLDAPDDLVLLHLGDDADSGVSTIGVLARARLQELLHACGELGLEVVAVLADGQCLPQPGGQSAALIHHRHLLLPGSGGGFVDVTLEGGDAETLLQLRHAAAAGVPAPQQLLTGAAAEPDNTGDIRLPALLSIFAQAWPDAPPPHCGQGDFVCPPGQPGFLIEQFATRRNLALGRIVRPAARLAGFCLIVAALALVGETVWLSMRRDTLRADLTTRFQTLFPQATLVDPLLQTQRQLAERRARAGRLAPGDLLAMLDGLAAAGQFALLHADYAQGQLETRLRMPPHQAAGLTEQLEKVGYRATATAAGPQAGATPTPPGQPAGAEPAEFVVRVRPFEEMR